MKDLVTNAIADMQSKIIFDSKKHVYVHADTGQWLQGVSTVSSIVPKDWLSAWGAKEAVKFLGYTDYEDLKEAERQLVKIKTMTPEQWVAYLKEAKGACRRKSKQALLDGSAGHEWLEEYVKAKIEGNVTPVYPISDLSRPLIEFVKWAEANVDYWIASEAKVLNEDLSYAGTLDAIAMMKNGQLALVDFKFATGISEDYYLQTAGYAACFEKYGINFDTRIIVRLPKTLEKEEYIDYKYVKVPNNLEVHTVWTDYNQDKVAFFGALPVKRWINYVENKGK